MIGTEQAYDHEEYDGLAVGWALHALEPADEQSFAPHLATCARCQKLVHESEETFAELAYDVPLLDPPAALRDRLREATGTVGADSGHVRLPPPTQAPAPRRPTRFVRWAAPALAAAAAIVVVLGGVGLQHRAEHAQQVAAARQTIIDQLAQSTTRAALRDQQQRTVGYVIQSGPAIKVVAGGLSPNDRKTTTYVLWAIQRAGGQPQAVGTFDVVRAGLDVRPVAGALPGAGVTAFSVSREAGRAAPARPTQIVATGVVPA